MVFLNSFEAVSYRGIDGLSLPRLARANLITGVNGIGKTAVLEAMWLFTGRYNTSLLWNANVQRSNKPVLDPVARLAKSALELRGTENGSSHGIKIDFQKFVDIDNLEDLPVTPVPATPIVSPPVVGKINNWLNDVLPPHQTQGVHFTPFGSVVFQDHQRPVMRPDSIILGTRFQSDTPNEYLRRYSDVVREGHKVEFTKAINLILPTICDLEILTNELGESYFSAIVSDSTRLPLHDLGGGFARLYQLFLDLFSARGGAVYVDELENGLHHSVLEKVWARSREWMRQWDVQLVATTHSDECIRAAMAAFEDAPDDLAIHKLYRNAETGKVEATTFTGETLEGARDLNLEIR